MPAGRPSVWLVSPAWRRFDVTRLALKQREHLVVELAARGIDCRTVIVADDENLEIAREHGCDTVEMDNDHGLGRRFNAGFQHAAREGADWFVHIGSDDWIHPDAFEPLRIEPTPRAMIAGRRIAFVDLLTGQMRRSHLDGEYGVIPWIIPRRAMEAAKFAPIRPDRDRGMDGYLVRGLRQSGSHLRVMFYDPHPLARVDFKSDTNINPYAQLPASLGQDTGENPWDALSERYPRSLVDQARAVHLNLREELCPS